MAELLFEHELFESLMHECAGQVEVLFNALSVASDNFRISAERVLAHDTIFEYVAQLENHKEVIRSLDLPMPLTLKKINKLLQYLD